MQEMSHTFFYMFNEKNGDNPKFATLLVKNKYVYICVQFYVYSY